MLKISHLPRIMIRMKRKGKAAVGGRVYQRSVCRYHEAKYPARPDIRDVRIENICRSEREHCYLKLYFVRCSLLQKAFWQDKAHFKMYAPLPQKGMETGMKKFRIWILAALAAALCLLCGCSAEDFALPHEVQLAVGQQCALAGELRFTGSLSDITPQDRAEFAQAVTDAVVHIASTDPSVAAVDQDGNVTAVTPARQPCW